jgi:thiol-disulfide isomerase/thioredoxin
MRPRRVASTCAAALVLAGCGASPAPAPTATASGGPTLTGKVVSITGFHGHPVVLIFWGSWCGPCRAEQPQLNSLYATWSPRGVDFLGIDLIDDNGKALTFQLQRKVPYPSIADPNMTMAINYRVPSAPALVFLDTHGRIAEAVLGGLGVMTVAECNAEISVLLGVPSASA